jgi:hypothetical protein
MVNRLGYGRRRSRNVQEIIWRNGAKLQRISVSVANDRAEIQTGYLPSARFGIKNGFIKFHVTINRYT